MLPCHSPGQNADPVYSIICAQQYIETSGIITRQPAGNWIFPQFSHNCSSTTNIPPFKSWENQRQVDPTQCWKFVLFCIVIAKELDDQGISELVLLPLP